ncbi:Gfo/Idh/MocA family oxidoreductase [Aureibaculum sp. 2210JD6-5]|uniref:Gfo/Idh/MocA family protein n=1 Tax=Aureibaculum sp. 2210JD6-5 TaxID=3103957 RepID=UPI002AAE1132|nr:Gfo/Idh/MocA family oxidoreductase [Aureibaculum sp. 2210JD6-5]MDY7396968.1 Gfo/Idh/MocA family oxidoreductase [Aureibaculum sp. 2210JD6-5]
MTLNQQPELPKNPLPIVIIGSGGIIKDAHLPAYTMAGFSVLGIYDKTIHKAEAIKEEFDIVEHVYDTLEELITEGEKHNAVFDLALPANLYAEILDQLPDGTPVLIQKPMGENLEEAKQILEICNRKKLISAVNFQLRFAPYNIVAREMINKGLIGDVYDMELMVCVYTPWHLWDFLFQLPRVEILYHSVHYLDLIRSFLGNPINIYASTIKLPKMKDLSSTRTTMILNYDEYTQARVITNHGHEFGLQHQQSYFKIEGTKGAIKIRIGLSMDYPKGLPAKFEYKLLNDKQENWKEIEIKGGWFPEAFVGTMAGLQRHVLDKNVPLPHSTADAYETMRLVEAAYTSSEMGGVPLSSIK